MSTAVAPAPTSAEPTASAQPRYYRLSVAQYEQMVDQGVLTKQDRVELIEGFLVTKWTKNSPHIEAALMIQEVMPAVLPAGWVQAPDIPVLLARSAPEPDFMVLRGRGRDYHGRKPVPGDVAFIIEVSDSSLAEDRANAPLFAEAGIPTYWIANLPERRIEVYSDPAGMEYRSRVDYGMDVNVPLVLDGREVARLAVRDLLPPPEKG